MNQRKYMPSFAEKLDRLNIVIMKSVYSSSRIIFDEEIENILHDIQLDIDEGVVVNAKVIKMLVILTQANSAIWMNEDFIRQNIEGMNDAETASKLTYTHRLNGTRSIAKTMIQKLIGDRTDPKINCLAEHSAWDISW